MGFLKNGAIKSTTKKRAERLRRVLEQSSKGKREALLEYKRIDIDPGFNWAQVFAVIVWLEVNYELSYDETIGMGNDQELCIRTCLNLLEKWYPGEVGK